MDIKLEKTDNVSGKIVVNVTSDDYADKVKSELKKIAATHVIPGFRKGHVPMNQLIRRFGRDVKSDVLNNLVFQEVYKYIQDNKLHVLGEPMPVERKEINLDDNDYTFEYRIGLAPDFKLNVNKDITIPYYTIEVSDQMRQDQDKSLRERLGSQVPGDAYEDRALVKGVMMELNPDGTVKETEDAIQVTSTIVAPFYFKSKEEAAKFEGTKVGDKVVFNPYASCEGNVAELASMLNIDKDKAADVKADFELAISEYVVLRPAEHDQEFFNNVFGADKVHNEDEYTKALTDMIAASLAGNSRALFARDVRKYFTDKYADVELPEAFLKEWLVARNEGLKAETIDEEFVKMRPDLIWQLVSDDITRQFNIEVKEENLLDAARQYARQQFAQYGMTNLDDETITDYAKRLMNEKDFRRRIYESVDENLLFAAVHQAVTLDEKTVTLDEFKKIAEAE